MFLWEGVMEFVAVAERESFTSAAKQLGISTAQVSRQISALEGRLSTKLFYRTTRKVSLTEEGAIYYRHCRQVLDGLEEAERAITSLRDKPQGLVKLTAPVTYGEKFIMPLINDFQQLYPDVLINMDLTNQQVDLVEAGYDLAIRLGRLSSSSMMAKRLTTRTQFVCGSPDYLAKYGTPHSLSELHQHNCLVGNYDHWHFQDQGKDKSVKVGGSLRCNSGYGLLDAVRKGTGLSQLPDYYVADDLADGSLVAVLTQYQEPEEGIWALYPHNRHLSPKVRMLVDYLALNLT
ncbi:LysR substrate-binding domain-containing protein [Photobacterium sanguinicancri]|uniref:LysR substrate-binding domain-containing protein n=1 Tax=Photobacterium sanguinicancri TaxID=875932 RepID=A0AAW7Y5V9_9GAMM|nr:LysR substrate-binding domain-containing protein [Photobacterium sanguinicancri]KXI22879.1 LysR family transcriptional regulator [Photobacterium sanguinicancri]MDO6543772.1 LysR substrate-binding domain-containing protein [Photobacterium sanguinicancri]